MDTIETSQSTGAIEFLTWLEVNKKRLVIGGVIALGVATIVVCYNHFAEQKIIQAGEALTALNSGIPGSPGAKTATAEQYLKVASDYSGTPAAADALLAGATALFTEQKYDQAQIYFGRFLSEQPAHSLAGTAALGLAACLDATGKTDAALAKYEEVSRQYGVTDRAAASQAKLAAGRIYQNQNKLTQAYQAYRELAEAGRGTYSPWSEEAGMRMMQLQKSHPELATPPSAPATSVQPVPMQVPPTPAPAAPATTVKPPAPAAKAPQTAPPATSTPKAK